jgi:hypothetical protein
MLLLHFHRVHFNVFPVCNFKIKTGQREKSTNERSDVKLLCNSSREKSNLPCRVDEICAKILLKIDMSRE